MQGPPLAQASPATPPSDPSPALLPPLDDPSHGSSNPTTAPLIFLSLIAYRDPELVPTLRSLFSQANHPARLVAGIVWQGDEGDATDRATLAAIDELVLTLPSDSVRQLRLPHTEARGPCYARALAQQRLYGGERFYLQLDSHMRVARGWDDELIRQWHQCGDERAIISTYPPPYERDVSEKGEAAVSSGAASSVPASAGVPAKAAAPHLSAPDAPPLPPTVLCASHFDATDGMLRIVGRPLSACPPAPLPSSFLAAGFLFGPGTLIADAPYDPHLQNLFFGEETSLAARLHTSGYAFFAPTRTAVWHCWTRGYRPNFRELLTSRAGDVEWPQRQRQREEIARERVRHVLGMRPAEKAGGATESLATSASHPETSSATSAPSAASVVAPDDPSLSSSLCTPLPPYSLGSRRPLASFYACSGVDFASGLISDRARNGGVDPALFKPDPKQAQLEAVMRLVRAQQEKATVAK